MKSKPSFTESLLAVIVAQILLDIGLGSFSKEDLKEHKREILDQLYCDIEFNNKLEELGHPVVKK